MNPYFPAGPAQGVFTDAVGVGSVPYFLGVHGSVLENVEKEIFGLIPSALFFKVYHLEDLISFKTGIPVPSEIAGVAKTEL